MLWLSKEIKCCSFNYATFPLPWACSLCCLCKEFASKKRKTFLSGQWSERTRGKRKVAQWKWQLLLSVDSQSISQGEAQGVRLKCFDKGRQKFHKMLLTYCKCTRTKRPPSRIDRLLKNELVKRTPLLFNSHFQVIFGCISTRNWKLEFGIKCLSF